MRIWSTSTGHKVDEDRFGAFFVHLDFVLQCYSQTEKGCQNLFASWRNGAFQIGNLKCSSSSDDMFGKYLTLLNNQ